MNYYRDITLAAPSTTLSSFPLLVRIQNDKMKARIASPQGYDVAFQQNGTDLPFELDFYDSATGSGAWWVQIPSLPANVSSTIRMIYGDSTITTNQSSPTTVWSDYVVVCHFSEANTSQQLNSVTNTYGTWSEHVAGNKTISVISGGVTGRMLSIYQPFHWNNPSSLQFNEYVNGNSTSFTVIYKSNMNFNRGGGGLSYLANSSTHKICCDGYRVYESVYNRASTPLAGTLEYMNSTWNNSDSSLFIRSNDSTESTTLVSGWCHSSTSVGLLRCYYGDSAVWLTTEIDEIRVKDGIRTQEEVAYEYQIVMKHAENVTYGGEFHTDGTPVIDFHPWLTSNFHIGKH